MNRQPVVTAFIQNDDKILLLKRGKRAKTYPSRWSGVSGEIEANEQPGEAAYREIHEEVGITRGDLMLVASAPKVPVYDAQADSLWIVNPFRFTTKTSRIKLGKENDDFRWASEHDLLTLDTVPKLIDAYHATLPVPDLEGFEPELRGIISQIRNDRERGASELAQEALTAMKVSAMRVDAGTVAEFTLKLTRLARSIKAARPGMAAIGNALGRFVFELHEMSRHAELAELQTWSASYAIELQDRSREAVRKAAIHASELISDHQAILTHSYSSSVREAILRAVHEGKKVKVAVAESKPLGEGARLAADLASEGVDVKLIPDSASVEFAKTAGGIFVGADGILSDGSFLNKIGTLSLGLAAKRFGASLYVVCETSKFILESLASQTSMTETVATMEGGEIPLFDLTPGECVTKFATEVGALSCGEIEGHMRDQLQRTYL